MGNGYTEIHGILHQHLGGVMTDAQIRILARKVCNNVATMAKIGILDEFRKTYLHELRDECTDRIKRIFNDEKRKPSDGKSKAD